MHPDSSYHKWESSKQMELAVQGESSTPGRAGKALCHSNCSQGKAIEILYLLLAICIAVATALIVVKLGKLSRGLAKAQLDRDTIRRDVKRNLSDHKDYLELKMSKEFNVFNSRLLNVSQGLAEAQLDRDAIRRDAQRNLSLHQDYIELKMSKEFNVFNSRLLNVSQGLAEAQLDRDAIRRDAQRNLSLQQDYLELKMSKEFNVFNSRLLNVSKELAGVRLGIEEIQADNVKGPSHLQDATEIRNLTHSMSKELAEVRRDHDRLQEVLSRVQDELRNITEIICTTCPPGWQHFEKNCYFFSTSTKSWLDAKQFCTSQESHLVIVNNKQEQTFLSNQLIEPDVYWLGLSDSAKEGEWRWVDDSPLSVRFWGPGEPNNVGQHGEDCVHLRFDGKWNDATCSLTEHWICEQQC
ncbi:low affinity immunoglobulin epsilon Fc receptor-like isoform X1 [Chrysemys picta bellii]|uniref:low affinity immunoglobulin epsilon Fc receptor-like isoform X1 n=1 Tax=Chrysemys picta bellii TaxID=8478 RepID=UPI0032B1CBF7